MTYSNDARYKALRTLATLPKDDNARLLKDALNAAGLGDLRTPTAGEFDMLADYVAQSLRFTTLEDEGAPFATNTELLALLPGTVYMDEPDGGAPSVLTQLQRMAEDARRLRNYVAKLRATRAELVRVLDTRPPAFIADELRSRVSTVDALLREVGYHE